MVRQDVRCFPTSSAGRLFDAAAAVLGFTREITYEGQAAIRLEQLARAGDSDEPYDMALSLADPRPPTPDPFVLDPVPLIAQLVHDRLNGVDLSTIARRFHATLAQWFAALAERLLDEEHLSCVALSGGVFQNALLLDFIADRLAPRAELLINETVPVNDGGIALGQAVLAIHA
ncbi:MAG: hypothetical protein A49_06140 [Methyloceanibacter sp.]|nr:MAG: hypothetical protein A49_06140 [Methyloceanibacter sp.]